MLQLADSFITKEAWPIIRQCIKNQMPLVSDTFYSLSFAFHSRPNRTEPFFPPWVICHTFTFYFRANFFHCFLCDRTNRKFNTPTHKVTQRTLCAIVVKGGTILIMKARMVINVGRPSTCQAFFLPSQPYEHTFCHGY